MKRPFLRRAAKENFCSCLLHNSSSTATISTLLKIQAFILRNALDSNIQLFTQLIVSFSNHIPLLNHARLIFHNRPLHTHDTFLCNVMLKNHSFSDAILLYNDLRSATDPHRAFSPNAHTFTILFSKSTNSSTPPIHTHVFKLGFCGNSFVSTTLVDLYAKFGEMDSAMKVFDAMLEWNPVVWTTMFVGYAKVGNLSIAMELFDKMPVKDIVSFNAMLDVHVKSGDIAKARNLFDQIPDKNIVSWTSLLNGYCNAGDLENARRVFDEMPAKNIVSWNTLLNGYYRNGKLKSTLSLFMELHSTSSSSSGTNAPNSVTLISVLPAIADLAALEIGRQMHQYIQIHNLLDANSKIRTSLIDMYAKCGDIKSSLQIFQTTETKQSSTYNAMINALAITGHIQTALDLFSDMYIQPDTTTMVSVLSACAHGGCITQGSKLFREMKSVYGITPQIEHYGCMVDLLGRSGRLSEAETLVNVMSPVKVNEVIVTSLLSSCMIAGDVERAERMMKKWNDLELWNVGNYVIMRNLYLKKMMREKAEEMARKISMVKETGVSYVSGVCGIEKEVVECI